MVKFKLDLVRLLWTNAIKTVKIMRMYSPNTVNSHLADISLLWTAAKSPQTDKLQTFDWSKFPLLRTFIIKDTNSVPCVPAIKRVYCKRVRPLLELKLLEIAWKRPKNHTIEFKWQIFIEKSFLIVPPNTIFFPHTNAYNFVITLNGHLDAQIFMLQKSTPW